MITHILLLCVGAFLGWYACAFMTPIEKDDDE